MTQKGKKKAPQQPADVQRLSGPRSRFRHKVRSPKSVLLTPEGHAKLAQEIQRTGLSVSDLFETLLHDYGDKLVPIQGAELEQAAAKAS